LSNKIILAGDVGGTKTLLALYECSGSNLFELKLKRYESKEYSNLEIIVNDFLSSRQIVPQAAAFGIPGPVENGKVKSTNLPWLIDEKTLSKHTGIPKLKIVNDLAATAFDIPYLKQDEIILIKDGKKERRSERYVVVAPGTGLGQAFLICDDDKKIVLPSEGGHADFASTNEIEAELFLYLLKKFGRVSYERIISGNGLLNIFDFLVETNFSKPKDKTIARMKTEDKAAVISEQAISGKDRVCEKALNIFISVLGAHSGNLVITLLATGGVYLGGGIPHKILPKLKDAAFTKSFVNKGRLKNIVDETPVYVINNNYAALHGAARIAESLMTD
jgi:glucokinase